MTGRRNDRQGYERKPWIKPGKLFWLDPDIPEGIIVRDPANAFPYDRLEGRRHPYRVGKAEVIDPPVPSYQFLSLRMAEVCDEVGRFSHRAIPVTMVDTKGVISTPSDEFKG